MLDHFVLIWVLRWSLITLRASTQAFRSYKLLGADVLLLQETHFSSQNHPLYFDKTFQQGYYTTYESKTRGVAIFIKNSVMFDVHHTFRDLASRFVIVQGSIQGKGITMASVYAPNESQASFLKNFFQTLDKYHSPHMMIGGDFNLVAHSRLDRSRTGASTNAFPKSLLYQLRSHQLLDTWKAHNMGTHEYTFYFHPHNSYSRLDYIYCTPV